jgi:hypothetical protein
MLHARQLQNSESPTHHCMLHDMTHLITWSWLKTHQIFNFNISIHYFIMPWIQLSKAENSNSLCLHLASYWSCCHKNCIPPLYYILFYWLSRENIYKHSHNTLLYIHRILINIYEKLSIQVLLVNICTIKKYGIGINL